jgi:hypothetical protein
MRWTTETADQEAARKKAKLRPQWERERKWHRWFAWSPVETSPNETSWLCMVERRLWGWNRESQPEWYFWDIRHFEYRQAAE